MRGVPSLFYDTEHGLVLFVPDFNGGFTVWDTAVEQEEMQFISDVVAYGSGFRSGCLTQVFVQADGQVLAYVPELRQAVLDPALQWLGILAEVCDITLNKGHGYYFSFATGIAAVRLSDRVCIVDDSDNSFEIARVNVSEKNHRGWPRPNRQLQEASIDFLVYKQEGKRVGVGLVGKVCSTTPLDDTRIAIFDRVYQRMVIAEKANDD